MKKPLIILDGFLILLIAVLGLALFHNVQEQSKEHSLSNSTASTQNSTENKTKTNNTGIKINTKEIKKENFMTLSGLWKNSSIAKKTKTLVISGPSVTFEGQQYDLTLEGVSSENELPYLKLIGEGINSGKFLGIYPQGSAIPVRLANGKIDYAGQYDPTDKKKDRIILFNDYMSAQDIIEQVLYRELEEIF
ncbi:hypothetical protein GJI78_03440 [Lactococcus lactis subsp. cremoris]|uniref:Uncharacterized protein n=1 Tax=Lactococcus lactis subsp. lactis (strain IL1403) TaxID=272623 RepID=Q9CEJ3_LACLA|nr:hypothetical protein [Lactococcus lactis]MRM75547.1 hypothetical protein [Lactococcus cremoris]AAK05946.1 unknown protein [Lactococcus lactis subsp. lactis Il1403]AYV51315.1 hypothetical protein EFD52_08600 [Lactococcus lactis]AYV53558.1 hypothetical protein EFV54_09775 [Lactococcus lactis]MRL46547.1 hypothetical protein [Lactococcus lactis subsp. lactis]